MKLLFILLKLLENKKEIKELITFFNAQKPEKNETKRATK